jgi:hypothetical protein
MVSPTRAWACYRVARRDVIPPKLTNSHQHTQNRTGVFSSHTEVDQGSCYLKVHLYVAFSGGVRGGAAPSAEEYVGRPKARANIFPPKPQILAILRHVSSHPPGPFQGPPPIWLGSIWPNEHLSVRKFFYNPTGSGYMASFVPRRSSVMSPKWAILRWPDFDPWDTCLDKNHPSQWILHVILMSVPYLVWMEAAFWTLLGHIEFRYWTL